MRVVSLAEFAGLQTATRSKCSRASVLEFDGHRGGSSFSVSVLNLDGQVSHDPHASGTLTSSPSGLERPVVASDLSALALTGSSIPLLCLVPVLLAAEATKRM